MTGKISQTLLSLNETKIRYRYIFLLVLNTIFKTQTLFILLVGYASVLSRKFPFVTKLWIENIT